MGNARAFGMLSPNLHKSIRVIRYPPTQTYRHRRLSNFVETAERMKRAGGDGGTNPRKKRGGWDEGAAAPFTPITGCGPPQFQTPGSDRPWERVPKKQRDRHALEPRSRGSAGLLTPRSLSGTLYVGNMPSGMATEPMLTGLFTKAVSCCDGFDPALGPPVLSVQMCGGGTCTPLPSPSAHAMPDEVPSHCASACEQTHWSSSATCSSPRPRCSSMHACPRRTLTLTPTPTPTLTSNSKPSPSSSPNPDPNLNPDPNQGMELAGRQLKINHPTGYRPSDPPTMPLRAPPEILQQYRVATLSSPSSRPAVVMPTIVTEAERRADRKQRELFVGNLVAGSVRLLGSS